VCGRVAYLLTRKIEVELPEDLVKMIESTGKTVDEVVNEILEDQLFDSRRPSRTQ